MTEPVTPLVQMIDLSAVWPADGENTLQALVSCARKYHCGLVSTLPAQAAFARDLLAGDPLTGLGGNVGFPSGGQTWRIKIAEAGELIALGCRELDMVINVANLASGRHAEVLNEIRAVIAEAGAAPVKVILEVHYLTEDQIRKGCDLCIQAGAAFVKTGTGWAPTGATLEIIRLIKSHVGDAIGIKASGGIRDAHTLLAMYRLGARRFGIGLKTAASILPEIQEQLKEFH